MEATSFISEQEKMIDFFTIDRKGFLEFYSYITDEEYQATITDVLKRSGYWNNEALAEDWEVEGVVCGKIVRSIMMQEWLLMQNER